MDIKSTQRIVVPVEAESELGQNASAAQPYKHWRQRENYISVGAPDELGNLAFRSND